MSADASSAERATTDQGHSSARGNLNAEGATAHPRSGSSMGHHSPATALLHLAAKQTTGSAAADALGRTQQQRAATVKPALTRLDQGLNGLQAGLTRAVAGVQQGLAQAGQGFRNALSEAAGRVQHAAAAQPRTFFALKALSAGTTPPQQISQWLRRLLL